MDYQYYGMLSAGMHNDRNSLAHSIVDFRKALPSRGKAAAACRVDNSMMALESCGTQSLVASHPLRDFPFLDEFGCVNECS